MIGKLFLVGFEGTTLSEEIKNKLLRIEPAGVILYDTNIESRDQVKKLTKELKETFGQDFIITTDQEGGKVERLRKICTSLPSLWALGKASLENEYFIERHASILAKEMLDLGFNYSLAPCVDLCTNPNNPIIGTRSLGSDSDLVAKQVKEIIAEFKRESLVSCAKHFPGHGDTKKDSHTELPVVHFKDLERKDTLFNFADASSYYRDHIKPFKSAIEAGVESIMVSHVAFPQLENTKLNKLEELVPASLSPNVINGELRERLAFKGLVVSDEMTMKAVSNLGHFGETSRRAIEAGCDLLIWNTNLDEPLKAIEYLESLVKELDDSSFIVNRINESRKKIEEFKSKLNTETKTLLEEDFIRHEEMSLEIASAAIDWNKAAEKVKSELTKAKFSVLAFDHPKLEVDLIKELSQCEVYTFNGTESYEDLKNTLFGSETVIVLAFQEDSISAQKNIINDLKSKEDFSVIHCSCDLQSEGSDVNMYGVNKIHLKAFFNETRS